MGLVLVRRGGDVPGLQRRPDRRPVPAAALAVRPARPVRLRPGHRLLQRAHVGAGPRSTPSSSWSRSGSTWPGWPYGFSLALLLLPFLTRRRTGWDHAHGSSCWPVVLAYVAEFYHGIAFGPRYYFEALPSFVILTARGFTALTDSAAALADAARPIGRVVAGAPGNGRCSRLALLACNFVLLPAAPGRPVRGLLGPARRWSELWTKHRARPRRAGFPTSINALVVTDEWWFYTMLLRGAELPDARLPDGVRAGLMPSDGCAAYPPRLTLVSARRTPDPRLVQRG